MENYNKLADKILSLAKKAGAQKAELFIKKSKNAFFILSDNRLEISNRSLTRGFGLSFIKNARNVFVDSSDFRAASISETVDKASQLSAYADEDQFHDIADLQGNCVQFNLLDKNLDSLPFDTKVDYARAIEKNALQYDKRIKKASGIMYDERIEEKFIANTNGLRGGYETSSISIDANVLGEEGEQKQEGSYGFKIHFFKDLRSADEVAKRACDYALSLIGGQPVKTAVVPVVFAPSAGWSLLRWGLFEAVKGLHVIRKFSYLTGMLGQRVASSNVTIIDDGTIEGGAGTAPFDDQGVKTAKNVIVESGILKMYIYDVYSAKMAGAKPTGNALRESYKDQPEVNPRNLYMVRGQNSPESIIQAVVNGFWVQNTIGFGVDSISGTYSIGAAGRWIREGRLAEPVSGVTIASSLNDLFNGIDAVGNDLEFRYETAVPTFRVKEMTVSGV